MLTERAPLTTHVTVVSRSPARVVDERIVQGCWAKKCRMSPISGAQAGYYWRGMSEYLQRKEFDVCTRTENGGQEW